MLRKHAAELPLVESLTELHVLTVAAIVEAFQFEVALFLNWDGQLSVAPFGRSPLQYPHCRLVGCDHAGSS